MRNIDRELLFHLSTTNNRDNPYFARIETDHKKMEENLARYRQAKIDAKDWYFHDLDQQLSHKLDLIKAAS